MATADTEEDLQTVKDFGVYNDVGTSRDSERYLAEGPPTMWVKRKGCTGALPTSLR